MKAKPRTSPIASLAVMNPQGPFLNLNSLLSALVLAVVGWVGMKTASNADSLIKIETSQPYLTQTVSELKSQLATLVTRAEFDSRLAEAKQERVSLESRIHTLEIEMKTTEVAKAAKATQR